MKCWNSIIKISVECYVTPKWTLDRKVFRNILKTSIMRAWWKIFRFVRFVRFLLSAIVGRESIKKLCKASLTFKDTFFWFSWKEKKFSLESKYLKNFPWSFKHNKVLKKLFAFTLSGWKYRRRRWIDVRVKESINTLGKYVCQQILGLDKLLLTERKGFFSILH